MWLEFRSGHLFGSTGCNSLTGEYAENPGEVTIRKVIGTFVLCSGEPALVERLREVRHVTADGNVRYLRDADERLVAKLDPALTSRED